MDDPIKLGKDHNFVGHETDRESKCPRAVRIDAFGHQALTMGHRSPSGEF